MLLSSDELVPSQCLELAVLVGLPFIRPHVAAARIFLIGTPVAALISLQQYPIIVGAATGVARINGGASSPQGDISVPWGAVIGEGPQPWIPGEVGRLEGNGAAGGIVNEVRPQ